MAVAVVEARAADGETGRGVATSHDTVAKIVGCSARTVRRVRTLLEKMQLATTVVAGRYLTTAERAEARQAHGGRQIRIASTRNLTMTKAHVKKNGHLPRRGNYSKKLPPKKLLTKKRKSAVRKKFPLEIQRLACRLAKRMPWLAKKSLRPLCQVLTTLKVDADRWTASRIMDALARKNQATGLFAIHHTRQKNALAFFTHEMRCAGVCAPDQATAPPGFTPSPPDSLADQAKRRAEARQARLQARAAERDAAAAFKADPVAQQKRDDLMERTRRELRASTGPRISARQRRSGVLT